MVCDVASRERDVLGLMAEGLTNADGAPPLLAVLTYLKGQGREPLATIGFGRSCTRRLPSEIVGGVLSVRRSLTRKRRPSNSPVMIPPPR